MTNLPASTASNQKKETFQFPEVRVVEASAGSGKTYALAKRYIQLLLSASDPAAEAAARAILAITFTNKAAMEMKDRILEFLKNIALKKLSASEQKEILLPLGISMDEAAPKAFAMMEAIIRHYNFFQVQTIDKFINALLSGCAFKIGLTAHFKIKTSAREYLEYALDETIDRAARDKDIRQIFEYFLHNYLYLENRSGWFPKRDMAAILYALFLQSNTYGGTLRPVGSPREEGQFSPEDIIRKKKTVLEDMKALRENLPEDTDQKFVKSLDGFLEENTRIFDIDSVSTYFAREELPVRKDGAISAVAGRLWAKIRRNLKEICDEEARCLFNPYIRVFEVLQSALKELTAKDDVLFLEELNKKAGRLFDEDHVTVAELYYRLASRFRHYLIDEFQDTSRLQWHNLEKMVEEALSTGGSLFYVGDRKQAIYGFRGGEVGLFDDIVGRFQAFPVEVEYLTKNWRSQKAIVDFNNTIFSPENLKNFVLHKEEYERGKKKSNMVEFNPDDHAALTHLFQSSRQSVRPGKDGGYVRVEAIAVDQKDERDGIIRAKVTGLIKELRGRPLGEPRHSARTSLRAGRVACGDIAVLTRNNVQVEQMTRWLLEDGIPVSSERTSDITQNRIVQEIITFLRFLDSPIDNLAFSTFVLGDILPEATGISREAAHEFVFHLRERLEREKDLYAYMEFRERFKKVWDKYFDEFFGNVGLYPLYELVVSIYNRFGLLEHFPGDQGFLMHLLELIKKQEEEHSDITSFLEYFDGLIGEDLYVRAAKSDAVQILTVHKAKGLEFPVVILPYLGMDVQVGTTGDDYTPSYVLRQEDSSLELLRLKSKYYPFSEDLYAIYAQEYKRVFLAELNNIYVALTRAQDELYAFIPRKVGNSFNLVQLLIPENIRETGAPGKTTIRRSEEETAVMELPASQYHDWIDYLKDEFLPAAIGPPGGRSLWPEAGAVHNRAQRLRGEAIHFMLSLIGNLDNADLKESLARAQAQAQSRFPYVKDSAEYMAILEKLFQSPKTKPFFHCGKAQVLTEKEIVNTQGHLKRLDRLIIGEKDVRIVDFKSSRDGGEQYVAQVRDYMKIVATMYPGKAVKGSLVYLDSIEVEEVEIRHKVTRSQGRK
ncbi:MAG: UvrD-helicase domain-containing protein [Candidatus Omnitrophica bacterium]|nr:UvrD-helicase domain-containing protein [Candidatus Omnitrophota bacterium]